jgi:tripartite ATP-independent transporter DctM subunit
VDVVCRVILVAAVLGSCFLIFASVIQRAITRSSIVWANDATAVLMTVAAFVGCVTVFYHGDHVGLYSLSARFIRGRARREVDAGVNVIIGVFALTLARSSGELSTDPGLGTFGSEQWSTHLLYIPLCVGMSLVTLLAVLRLLSDVLSKRTWIGPLVAGLVIVAAYLFFSPLHTFLSGNVIALTAGVIVVAMLVGMPISFAIGIGTMLGILFSPIGEALDEVPLQMTNLVTNITLIALPFFVLAGAILGRGAVAVRLVLLLRRLSHNMRGGEGVAAVVCMYIFSGLSGSKFADIAAIAPGVTEGARAGASGEDDERERLEEMSSVLTASAVMGETVPPSIMLLALASVTTISTGALFVAGLAPAAVLGCAVIVLILIRGRRFSRPAADRQVSWFRSILGAIPALVGIAIIAGGLIGGFSTPSEASSLATIYSIVLIGVFYRVGWRELVRTIDLAARLAGMLLFLISITGALAWFFSISGLADDVVKLFDIAGSNKLAFMLISAAILVILGSVFEGLPAILIFAPILVPEAAQLGINTLQYGIVLLMALGVGTFLPPFGIGYYATCAIVGVAPERTFRRTLTYMVPVAIGVLIIAVVPQVTTFLVTLFHLP